MDCTMNFILVLSFILDVTRAGETLLQANIHFRHGDRAPFKLYPKYEYPEDSWPFGLAQLLIKGKLRAYEVGKKFRQRYITELGLLHDNKYLQEIHVRSTDVDRTLMTAQCILTGMYPPQEPVTSDIGGLGWQPIPVHTLPRAKDFVVVSDHNCPRWRQIWKQKLKELQKNWEELHPEFWAAMKKNSGEKITADTNVFHIMDAIKVAQLADGKTRPKWVTDEFYGYVEEFINQNMKTQCFDDHMSKLAMGGMMEAIRNNMQQMVDKKKDAKKLYLYSGHDAGIVTQLGTLQAFDDKAPVYVAAVILELWQNDDTQKPFVRLFYRNDTSHKADQMKLTQIQGKKWTQKDLPFEEFLKVTEPFLFKNRTEECQAKEEPTTANNMGHQLSSFFRF